jgi:hypothetical protein
MHMCMRMSAVVVVRVCMCVCACICVCAHVRACVRVCVCLRMSVMVAGVGSVNVRTRLGTLLQGREKDGSGGQNRRCSENRIEASQNTPKDQAVRAHDGSKRTLLYSQQYRTPVQYQTHT